jgi:osmoprotectant transport system ATP-binding protein
MFPHLNARDNVPLAARVFGQRPGAIEHRLRSLADLVQLPHELLTHLPGELSGGQRQRVSLMRALMLDPHILLLDEPLGALDPMVRYGLQEDLKRLFKRLGKCVLLVTHDLAEAAYFSERIVLLRQGRIVQEGSYASLERTPADEFVHEFIRAQRVLHATQA